MDSVLITNITVSELRELFESSIQKQMQSTMHLQVESTIWMDVDDLREYLPDKPVRATVYAWVQARKLPFYKGSKRLAFLKSEIDDWLKNSRQMSIVELNSKADVYLKASKTRRNGK